MKRHMQILTAVLALQIALVAVLFWPRSIVSENESRSLLSDLEVGDVIAFTIEDADGNQINLGQSGGKWVLPDAGDYPCQEDQITGLLDKLVALDTRRLVTRTESSHKRLQVARDDFVRRIDLETAGGENYTLFLGSSPNYGSAHIRLQGQDETYLTDDLPSWEVNTSANSWVDASYLEVAQDIITTITLKNDNGEWALDRDADENWVFAELTEDEELDTNSVNSLVSRVSAISLLRPLGKEDNPAYRLDQPSAVVTLQTAEKTITLEIGAKFLQDNSYVIKSSESPYYVQVAEFSVKELVEMNRDGFIKPPPTPTPTTEGSTP